MGKRMDRMNRPILALGLRLAAMASLSVMLMLVKVAGTRGVSLPETLFWRQFFPGLMLLGYLAARGQLSILKTQRLWVHARRAAFGGSGMFLTLGAVILLPLAESTVLGFTAPMFAVILAAVVLKEPVGWVRWSAVILGLAGILVIAGPNQSHLPLFGIAVGVGAAFMVAVIAIQLRDLGRTEQPLTVVFWFSAFTSPVLALFLLRTGVHHDAADWLILFGIGLSGLIGQIFLTAALRYGSVSSVIVMDYSAFAWATLWGWLVFDHLPPASTWIGAPIVIAAGLIIAWREHLLHRQRAGDALTA
jgi:drug/metabolite transporter (DMT)-like permease